MFDMMNKPLWDMNEVSQTISPPPSPQLTCSWLLWASDDLVMHCGLWTSNQWSSCIKMNLGSCKLSRTTIGPLSHGKTLALLHRWISPDQFWLMKCNVLCNVNDLQMKWMYKWEVQIWGATAAPIQSTRNLIGWEQRLSDLQGTQGLNTKEP